MVGNTFYCNDIIYGIRVNAISFAAISMYSYTVYRGGTPPRTGRYS